MTTRAGMAQPPSSLPGMGRFLTCKIGDNDSIERWLTERYCLYTAHRGSVYRGEIHHRPRPFEDAHADFMVSTMAQAAGAGGSDMASGPSLGLFLSPGDAFRAAYNSRFSTPEENP